MVFTQNTAMRHKGGGGPPPSWCLLPFWVFVFPQIAHSLGKGVPKMPAGEDEVADITKAPTVYAPPVPQKTVRSCEWVIRHETGMFLASALP